MNLKERMLPAPRAGGFRMPDHWTWDGSVIRGDDGRYHLFASRWSKDIPFSPNWVACSEVVRAVADRPEGPYAYVETVIPRRGPSYWDGMMSHNPSIRRVGGKYLLFYTGTTYSFPAPEGGSTHMTLDQVAEARLNQQVGLLTADSLEGPWRRSDEPVLGRNPLPGRWDSAMATNPSPCILPDGSIRVIYKGVGHMHDFMRLGLATAPSWDRPLQRVGDGPLFEFDAEGASVEDPFIWHDGARFQLLMKDMEGRLCGEVHAGLSAWSDDAVRWHFRKGAVAYSRRVLWDDGVTTEQGNLERPSLLFDERGEATHFFAATAAVHFKKTAELTETHVMVIPLRPGDGPSGA